MREIIAGVDGSDHAREALRWALREGQVHGARVVALYAYDYTPAWSVYAYGEGMVAPPTPSPEDLERASQDAQRHAEALVDRMLTEVDGSSFGVEIERLVVADRRPAHALVERARNADLLVVGSRGRGGFMGLVLGSVSAQCAQHASCPVVIVRLPEDEEGEGD